MVEDVQREQEGRFKRGEKIGRGNKRVEEKGRERMREEEEEDRGREKPRLKERGRESKREEDIIFICLRPKVALRCI